MAAGLAVLLLSSSSLPALARAVCNTPAEISALQVRQLQIETMVATLKCGGGEYDYQSKYSAYVQAANPVLAENARQLKTMFIHQGKGASYLDRYITSVSNDAQIRSRSVDNYCEIWAQTLDKLLGSTPRDMPKIAAEAITAPYDAEPECAATTHKTAHESTGKPHTKHHAAKTPTHNAEGKTADKNG